jgi:hypothetical protein
MIMKVDSENTVQRSAADRLNRRIARLQSLIDGGTAERAQLLRELMVSSRRRAQPVEQILIRSNLLRAPKDHGGPSPLQAVSASKSAAVPVLLLTLLEMQTRSVPGRPVPQTHLAIGRNTNDGQHSWTDFTALPVSDSTRTRAHAVSPRGNRERQIKAALDRLAEHGRVELKPQGVRGRYERFRLLNEGTDNLTRAATDYEVPTVPGVGRARRAVVSVPVEFFLRGWIDALTDNEIITYLALRWAAQAFPATHAAKGVYLAQATRIELFNLDRGFDASRMLGRYGLIIPFRDPRRRADGTVDLEADEVPEATSYALHDAGLAEPAIPRMIAALTRFRDGFNSDYEALAHALDKRGTG